MSVVHTPAELERALAGRQSLVVQQHVGHADAEYTAGVIAFNGVVDAAIVMRRDLRDGNTYRAFVEPDKGLAEAVIAMGSALRPHGPANFQFRLDAAGVPRVFEINARFSGTTPLRALAGFNEVEMCARKVIMGEAVCNPRSIP